MSDVFLLIVDIRHPVSGGDRAGLKKDWVCSTVDASLYLETHWRINRCSFYCVCLSFASTVALS